jgi:hypothetical protein
VIAQFEVPGETRSVVLHPTLMAVTLSGEVNFSDVIKFDRLYENFAR